MKNYLDKYQQKIRGYGWWVFMKETVFYFWWFQGFTTKNLRIFESNMNNNFNNVKFYASLSIAKDLFLFQRKT